MENINSGKRLTHSEMRVLNELAKGLLYKEIAAANYVCIDTVKKHVKNLYRKLEVRNRTEAVQLLWERNERN